VRAERLKAAAAERWHVPVSEIEAQNSVLTHRPSGRRLRFGEVAASAAAIRLQDRAGTQAARTMDPAGQSEPVQIEQPADRQGERRLRNRRAPPGMLYAALMQSPVHGGKLKHCKLRCDQENAGVRGSQSSTPTSRASQSNRYSRAVKIGAEARLRSSRITTAARKALRSSTGRVGRQVGRTVEDDRADLRCRASHTRARGGRRSRRVKDRDEGPRTKRGGSSKPPTSRPFAIRHRSSRSTARREVTESRVDVWHPAAIPRSVSHRPPRKQASDRRALFQSDIRRRQLWPGALFADDVRLVVAIAKKSGPARASHLVARGSHAARP